MNPFSSTNWTKARGKLTVGLIWFLALTASSTQLIHGKAVQELSGNETIYICREVWPSPVAERTYTMIIFVITFVLPMIILVYTYTCIAWKMLNHTSPGNANAARDEAQLEAKMKVIKMLAVVVILFALCWLPLQLFNILYWFEIYIFDPDTQIGIYLHNGLFFLCHWLAMANSFLNPIIYCFMSDNFRTDLASLARTCSCLPYYRRTTHHGFHPISGGDNSMGSSFRTTTIVLRTSVRAHPTSPATGGNGQHPLAGVPSAGSPNLNGLQVKLSSDHLEKVESNEKNIRSSVALIDQNLSN